MFLVGQYPEPSSEKSLRMHQASGPKLLASRSEEWAEVEFAETQGTD